MNTNAAAVHCLIIYRESVVQMEVPTGERAYQIVVACMDVRFVAMYHEIPVVDFFVVRACFSQDSKLEDILSKLEYETDSPKHQLHHILSMRLEITFIQPHIDGRPPRYFLPHHIISPPVYSPTPL